MNQASIGKTIILIGIFVSLVGVYFITGGNPNGKANEIWLRPGWKLESVSWRTANGEPWLLQRQWLPGDTELTHMLTNESGTPYMIVERKPERTIP